MFANLLGLISPFKLRVDTIGKTLATEKPSQMGIETSFDKRRDSHGMPYIGRRQTDPRHRDYKDLSDLYA